MSRYAFRSIGFFSTAACFIVSAATWAGTPSVDDVLKVCRENQAVLDPLHVQCTYTQEFTEAFLQAQRKHAEQMEALAKLLESGESTPELEQVRKSIGHSPEQLREQAKHSRLISPKNSERCEFFLRGDAYQVRSFFMEPNAAGDFSDAPVTPASLEREYARRASTRGTRVNRRPGGFGRGSRVRNRPRMRCSRQSTSARRKLCTLRPIQAACSQHGMCGTRLIRSFPAPADRYRVVGQEEKDGQLRMIVDAAVPTEQQTGEMGKDGQMKMWKIVYFYRAWLDLNRGGIPVVMHIWFGREGQGFEEFQNAPPYRAMTTTEIRRLENGAHYPVVTLEEEYRPDPSEPQLTPAEWAEVQAGKRAAPKSVVHQRQTWSCSMVETKVPGDDSFFVLEFPKDQPLYDFDAQKIVGALEPLPTLKAGQPAPPWKVARWLDGGQHSLDEFRGKVVVLDFWGLWCGPCRGAVPALAALQEKYSDKPVVFVSIHTAEKDADALAQRIETFAAEQNWKYLAAIDAGTMTNNSATCHAYGVHGYPTQIVIGGEGVVKFNTDEPPPGMEGIQGKTESELTAADKTKFEAFQKAYMEGAGEAWPMDEHMTETEQAELMKRVNVFYMSRQIDAALGELK